jgi:hypothetical protein
MTLYRRITTPSSWRQIAVATILVAAISVATASTADAKPKSPADQFSQCVADLVKYNKDHGQTHDMNAIQGACCININGSLETQDDGVTFKDCVYPDASSAGRPAPPAPGATAILPPGSNTRAGNS